MLTSELKPCPFCHDELEIDKGAVWHKLTIQKNQCPLRLIGIYVDVWNIRSEPTPVKPKELAWECNQCGSQEYTMSVSERDVHRMGCSVCGGEEWHKAEST